jgi:hypothetical protein
MQELKESNSRETPNVKETDLHNTHRQMLADSHSLADLQMDRHVTSNIK